MKTKIGIPVGLALVMFIGIFTAMLALGVISPGGASADHCSASPSTPTDTSDKENSADCMVTGLSVVSNPKDPGAPAQYTIKFTTSRVLEANEDTIVLHIDSSVGVPDTMSASDVRISADKVTGDGSAKQSVNLALDPTRLDGSEGRDYYSITVPDMDPKEASGIEGIDADARVTVTILGSAGFTNPKESGNDDFKVSTIVGGVPSAEAEAKFFTPLRLSIDDKKDNSNTPITLTGRGFKKGTTAIVYLDKNDNGQRDNGIDVDLSPGPDLSILVEDNGTFMVTFNVTVPPFERLIANRINAIDGENPPNHYTGEGQGQTVPEGGGGKITFTIEPLLELGDTEVAVGDDLELTLSDWADGETVKYVTEPCEAPNEEQTCIAESSVTIAGIMQQIKSGKGKISDNSHTIKIVVGPTVPSGTQQLKVTTYKDDDSSGADDTKNIVVEGADLTATPETAVPHQSVTLSASGLGEKATITSVKLESDGTFIMPGNLNFNNGLQPVKTGSNGKWSGSLVIPITDLSTTPGTHNLTIKDDQGRSGTGKITIPERTLTVEPTLARPGEIVVLRGTGFPASTSKNVEQVTPFIQIEYDDTLVGSVSPDSSGNIVYSFRVPLSAVIPSTNKIEAFFEVTYTDADDEAMSARGDASTTHNVPDGIIELSQSEGQPGDTLTITGSGFKSYTSLTSMKLGDIELAPSPKPATDNQGEFETQILVPQIEIGTHNLVVTFGETDANAIFKILDPGRDRMEQRMMSEEAEPADAFAALIDDENLIRVWHFNAARQGDDDGGWTLYDTREAFMTLNTIEAIEPGQFYWLQVERGQDRVELGSETVDLFAGWNQIRW